MSGQVVAGATAALPARWRDDPFLLTEGERLGAARVWHRGAGLLLLAAREGRPTLVGHGDADDVATLVAELPEGVEARWLTVPRGAAERVAPVAHRLGLVRGADWDWWLTDREPAAAPGEGRVVALDPVRDATAIRACLAASNPGTEADPDHPGTAGWWAVPGTHGPVGVIGAVLRGGRPGGPSSWHLQGLGVLPGHRRGGLGAALTAAAVRAGLGAGAPWVSLGMYAENDAARRVYLRLGLRVVAERTSFRPV